MEAFLEMFAVFAYWVFIVLGALLVTIFVVTVMLEMNKLLQMEIRARRTHRVYIEPSADLEYTTALAHLEYSESMWLGQPSRAVDLEDVPVSASFTTMRLFRFDSWEDDPTEEQVRARMKVVKFRPATLREAINFAGENLETTWFFQVVALGTLRRNQQSDLAYNRRYFPSIELQFTRRELGRCSAWASGRFPRKRYRFLGVSETVERIAPEV